ncbi:B-box zinc finger protein [Paracoccus sp. ME4]|uniref:B-box zinc finger protein n=1 Tax=Paracoccus sp. ME4 TaxID=3138066 RepID=UPI00398B371F
MCPPDAPGRDRRPVRAGSPSRRCRRHPTRRAETWCRRTCSRAICRRCPSAGTHRLPSRHARRIPRSSRPPGTGRSCGDRSR